MANDNTTPTQTPKLDDVLNLFPADVRLLVKTAWQKIPDTQRQNLLELLPNLPLSSADGLTKLMELAQAQWQMAFGDKRHVVIIGPTNVGKSTLYNQLIQAKQDRAAVSAVPGTTRTNQTANAGLFAIVDTPGADAVGQVGQQERYAALTAAQQADFIILMFDALQGIKRTEQELFHEVRRLEKPYIVVLNKMDFFGGWRKRNERTAVVQQAARNLGLPTSQLIPIAAEEGDNLAAILLAIVRAEPALLAAMGQALPRYRSRLAWQAIVRAGSSSAVVALTPIPIVDFIPLLGIQVTLVMSIARIYNYQLTLKRAQELIGALGMGYLGRTLFYQLSKVGGPPGWLISSAVATSTTVLVGYTAVLWFSQGEKLTTQTTRRLLNTIAQRLIHTLRQPQKPTKNSLRDKIADALASLQNDPDLWADAPSLSPTDPPTPDHPPREP